MTSKVYYNTDMVRRTVMFDKDLSHTFTVNTEIDVEPIIDTNKAMAENLDPTSNNKLLARVPMIIYEQSIHEGWDEEDWKKWLNDPQNKPFRVWPGRV